MKPKALSDEMWNKMLRKYRQLNVRAWNNIDGLQKLALLRGAHINISDEVLFNDIDEEIKYPNDIYNFKNAKKVILDVTTLNKMRHISLEERYEVGGIICIPCKEKIEILFSGNQNRIDFNLPETSKYALTVFHTHPEDEDVEYDPPSVLDIISFLSFNIKSIADLILNRNKQKRDLLKIQDAVVFTKNEVYVYYLSASLVENIVTYLLKLLKEKDFIYEVEKLLEEVELCYAVLLSRFNMNLKDMQVNDYILYLQSLGIIMTRYKYLQQPEIYIY